MSRRGLSSDLHLEPLSNGPISASDASILDMVDAVSEEMLDTVPGTSRRELADDALRTAEMDSRVLAQLLAKKEETVAQRPPRMDDATRPEMPIELIESERLIAQAHQPRSGIGIKIFVGLFVFASVVASLWFFG